MKTERLPITDSDLGADYTDIDFSIAPIIFLLNFKLDSKTLYCCSGVNEEHDEFHQAYVFFKNRPNQNIIDIFLMNDWAACRCNPDFRTLRYFGADNEKLKKSLKDIHYDLALLALQFL